MLNFRNWTRQSLGLVLGTCSLALILILSSLRSAQAQTPLTLQVLARPMGITSRYIGATEGNVNFDIRDLQDLGINTYRLYGGMSRWEATDDDGRYGIPAIAQIKANPDLINWDWWDKIMAEPPQNSDYWWSGAADEVWLGNAETLFSDLKKAHIRPVLTIRNTDAGWNPPWALQLNPPRTEADWNEWWEHVFATVYWLNVRHDYQVDEFEIHNEPDNRQQGWGGTQEDYFKLVEVAQDAIASVYTYLPERNYHIHAPVTVGGSSWVWDALQTIPNAFDSVNIHNYDADLTPYTQQVRKWMQQSDRADAPLWLGEWGTYQTDYNDFDLALNIVANLVRTSQPGDRYIDGSHLFSMYDWGETFKGLIAADGTHQTAYYALRLGIRALQGGKTVLSLTSNLPNNIDAIAAQDDNRLYVLVVNNNATGYSLKLDCSTLFQQGFVKVWEFSQQHLDDITQQFSLNQGYIDTYLPAQSATVFQVNS
jgi:hypothetical protein